MYPGVFPVEVDVEQRKRESLIPKGTFDVGPTLDPVDRGDASGTFARMVSEAPAAPIARIGLVRQPAPVAPPPTTRRALRTAPPPPPASVRSTSMLPPPPPPARSVEPSLQALVAPTYPPPAPPLLLDESERVEFPDFGLRLDVPRLAPAPVSLLPLPNERRSDSKRGVAKWALLAVLLIAVGVAGWFSRGLVASAPVTSPRAPSTPEPALAAPVAVAPVVAPVVEEVATPVVEEAVTLAVEEVVVPEAVVAPVLESVPAQQPVASARSVAVAPAPRAPIAASAVAPTVEATVTVEPAVAAEPTVAAVEQAPAVVLEEVLAEELPETLERAEVIEGIEVLRNEYNSCVGDLHGIAEMRIRIANTGRVTHALAEGAYAGTPQGSCLARTLRQARFRPFVRSSIEIVYPLAL